MPWPPIVQGNRQHIVIAGLSRLYILSNNYGQPGAGEVEPIVCMADHNRLSFQEFAVISPRSKTTGAEIWTERAVQEGNETVIFDWCWSPSLTYWSHSTFYQIKTNHVCCIDRIAVIPVRWVCMSSYISQQTRHMDLMLDQSWANVVDNGPRLVQHCVYVSCFLGYINAAKCAIYITKCITCVSLSLIIMPISFTIVWAKKEKTIVTEW